MPIWVFSLEFGVLYFGFKQGYGEGYMRYANTAVKKVKKVVSAKSLQARSYDVSFDSYDVIRRRGVFYGA